MARLIVNADDLGYATEINRGILEAHERGAVTSASLMVDRPAAEHGAAIARRTPRLSVGLHSVLTSAASSPLRRRIALCDPRVHARLDELGIELIGWREL